MNESLVPIRPLEIVRPVQAGPAVALPRREVSRERPRLPPLFALLATSGVGPWPLLRALRQSRASGAAFEDVLYADGAVSEAKVIRALATRLGVAVAKPEHCQAAKGTHFGTAVRSGAIELDDGRVAYAPRGLALRRLLATKGDIASPVITLMRRHDILALALAADRVRVAARASSGLLRQNPQFSAAAGPARWQVAAMSMMLLVTGFLAVAATEAMQLWVAVVACAWFLLLAWVRLAACATPLRELGPGLRQPEVALPVYTILVPVYRERAALPGLIAALLALDYPHAKLDIKILVEERDSVTLRALARCRPPAFIEIIRVPLGWPRTKPRALNVGLSIARGEFTVVYDAEDRPAPGQLRHAAACFAAHGAELGVVQARLSIDPRQRGWIAEQFKMEFAGLFDVMLPALAAMHLPMPLGGTSNHFRTAVLREIGGWDAYNVTEDADAGLRLARFGYRAATIASRTEEEAPTGAGAWLRQRTRWLKGWMVTFIVHSRAPRQLVYDVGIAGALVFLLLTVGTILSALAEPFCLAQVVFAVFGGAFFDEASSMTDTAFSAAFLTSLVVGHGAAMLVGARGLARSGRRLRWRSVAFMPIYWLAISIAAWRALWQVAVAPQHWEKTDHVLSRLPVARIPISRS